VGPNRVTQAVVGMWGRQEEATWCWPCRHL